MTRAELDKRAELTVWPGQGPTYVAQGYEFLTLRDALDVWSQHLVERA